MVEESLVRKNEVALLKKPLNEIQEVKAYRRRWLILFIYIYYSSFCGVQWIEYSSITHTIVKYYNVSPLAVDWTTTIFMALYPLLIIPATYIMTKQGLRTAGIIGCVGTFLGTGVKVFSVNRDSFWVVLLGQGFISASQLAILSLPPKLAATWFRDDEVSTACSLGVFGVQIGVALGYIVPPLIVQDSNNAEDVGNQLNVLCWLLTGCMIPVTIAVLLYFPNGPSLPPSHAQVVVRQNKEEFNTKSFFDSIKKLFLNKAFLIHMVAYSMNASVISAVGTLLIQFILQHFEGETKFAGCLGFIMIVGGTIGTVIFGIILDKTHEYKKMNVLLYLFSTLSIVCLMFILKYQVKIMTYISCFLLGFFINGYMPVGLELAIELTFPIEENTTSGILLASSQIAGTIFSVGLGYFNKSFGAFWSLGTQAIVLFIGTLITTRIPNVKLRQEALKNCYS